MKHILAVTVATSVVLLGMQAARGDAGRSAIDLRVADVGGDDARGGAVPTPIITAPPAAPPAVARRSPGNARALSVGVPLGTLTLLIASSPFLIFTTEVGVFYGAGAVGVLGLGAGPSAGHFYAGEWRHGLLFTGLRIATFVAGVALTGTYPGATAGPGDIALASLGSVCGATAVGLTIYDIWDSARAARRYNARARARAAAGISASVVPQLDPQRRSGGLALVGAF